MTVFHKKAPYSIKKVFLRYFLILFLFTSGALILYCVLLVKSHFDQTAHTTNTTLNYYINTLETELEECALFEQKLCYSDSSFQLLTLHNLRDSDKVTYLYNVSEMLKRQVSPYECIMVFNEDMSVSALATGTSFSASGTHYVYLLKENLRSYWLDGENADYNQWITFQDENFSLLIRAVKIRDVYVCTAVNLNQIDFISQSAEEEQAIQLGFFDSRNVLSDPEVLIENELTLDDLITPPKNQILSSHYLVTAPVGNTQISMFCLFSTDYIWSFTRGLITLFILIALVTCFVIVFTFYSFNKILLYPLVQTSVAMKHLEQSGSEQFLEESHSDIVEYQDINEALASLMDQKVALYQEKQNEAFEKDHAKLQYYQLQTGSHFFVNCLKSLYNMLENREYEKMQMMIIAFSNHLRYVFHDNLKLVTLQSELAEVNDYYNIVLLDRTSPFILNTQVDSSLMQCRVPSLIIQTFLENTAKYNRQSDNLLIFDVRIEPAELNGKRVIQIMLSDNGTGYSEEVLERLNSSENDLFATKHVGISNLKHRIALIYKTDYQFAFYNKPSGGACGLIYLPITGNSVENSQE